MCDVNQNFVVNSRRSQSIESYQMARAALLLRDLTEEMGGRGLRLPHLGRERGRPGPGEPGL